MKNKLSFFSNLIIALTITILVVRNPQYILTYDNFGLYMYLPNTFIYHDITLKDITFIKEINEQYNLTPTLYQFDQLENGNHIIRFFSGIALLILPFFLLGHLFALISPFPPDGYSEPYVWAVVISGIFYALLGFYVLRRILLKFFSDKVAAITLLVFYFGTNVYFFSTMGTPYPHILILTLYAFLLYFTILWHENHQIKHAKIIGVILGLLMVSRPSEIIGIFIPLFWSVSDKKSLIAKIKLLEREWRQIVYVAIFAFISGLPQLFYWLAVAHKPVYFPYNDPQSGMNFLAPRFWWVLLSFRKGWLIYSPLMILSLTGFIFLYKKRREAFLPILTFFLINLYMIASFSSLVSYGYRAFVQSYGILIIPFGLTIEYLFTRKIWIQVILTFCFLGSFYVNIFQAWQIRHGILHGSRTTKEYYKAVFLKGHVDPEDRDLLLIERSFDGSDRFTNEEKYNHRIICEQGFEEIQQWKEKFYSDSIKHSGNYGYLKDTSNIYSPACKVAYKDITNEYYAWLRASLKVYPLYPVENCELRLVIAFTYKGKTYKYRSVGTIDNEIQMIRGQWNSISVDYLTPEVRSKDDKLIVYAWFRGKQKVYIDELKVEAFTLD